MTIGPGRLTAGHGAHDDEWFGASSDGGGQGSVRRFVGQIFLAGKEPHERSTLFRRVVADRPAQYRIAGLELVKDRALSGYTFDVELYFAVKTCERP
ncbi:MAG TPA: hypothetical protein VLL25_11480 [Acidimicrobiales bacterium]|nr:hypothetical protein [Acidimicrobiales bacterium]